MKKITKALFCLLAATAVVLADGGTSQSALNRSSREIIQIAYMNGYVAALQEDAERIRKLKEDSNLMREVVEQKAEEYLARVYEMNRD